MFFIAAIGIFVFGLIVGSFLNVLAFRFGFTEISRSRSACMACQAPLQSIDLVPVLSYMALRGRCRACGSRISAHYPVVELATGILFLVTFLSMPVLSSLGEYAGLLALLAFWASFVVIVVVDLRHTIVPLTFAYALIAAAVAGRLAESFAIGSASPLMDAAVGASAFGGAIALIVFVTRGRGMGAGDIYIAAAVGALFGIMRGLEVAALSFWIGAAVGLLLMVFRKGVRMKTELPFAPFMFVAALVGAFTTFSPFVLIAALSDALL